MISQEMIDSRTPLTPCTIRVVVNPKAEECYSLRTALYPYKTVSVKILVNHESHLDRVVREMKADLGTAAFQYSVKFRWANAPKSIQNDGHFKAEMFKLFASQPSMISFAEPSEPNGPVSIPEEFTGELLQDNRVYTFQKPATMPESGFNEPLDIERFETLIKVVITHMTDCGKFPEFTRRTTVGCRKICNYIRNVTGVPLADKECLAIADHIVDNYRVTE